MTTPQQIVESGQAVRILMPWPPSVNGYWRSIIKYRFRNGRKEAYTQQIKSADVRAYFKVAESAIRRQSLVGLFGHRFVTLEIHFHPKRRGTDIDNFSKALLDSMEAARVWMDDKQVIKSQNVMRKPIKGGLVVIYARLATPSEISTLETCEVAEGAADGLW